MDRNIEYKELQRIIRQEIEGMGLLLPNVQYGVVQSLGSGNKLNVFINGSAVATPNLPSNPNITFNINDRVLILVANRNLRDLYVFAKVVV